VIPLADRRARASPRNGAGCALIFAWERVRSHAIQLKLREAAPRCRQLGDRNVDTARQFLASCRAASVIALACRFVVAGWGWRHRKAHDPRPCDGRKSMRRGLTLLRCKIRPLRRGLNPGTPRPCRQTSSTSEIADGASWARTRGALGSGKSTGCWRLFSWMLAGLEAARRGADP